MIPYLHACPQCGTPVTKIDRFCAVCGFQVSRTCPGCEHDVWLDSIYCNYCGTGLTPLDAGDKMTRRDRARLLHQRELDGFHGRVEEFEGRLAEMRERFHRRRLIEMAAICSIVAGVVFFLLPYVEEAWNQFFADHPARNVLISGTAAVLVILVTFYFLDLRRQKDRESITELQTRLALSQSHLEEAEHRGLRLPPKPKSPAEPVENPEAETDRCTV